MEPAYPCPSPDPRAHQECVPVSVRLWSSLDFSSLYNDLCGLPGAAKGLSLGTQPVHMRLTEHVPDTCRCRESCSATKLRGSACAVHRAPGPTSLRSAITATTQATGAHDQSGGTCSRRFCTAQAGQRALFLFRSLGSLRSSALALCTAAISPCRRLPHLPLGPSMHSRKRSALKMLRDAG